MLALSSAGGTRSGRNHPSCSCQNGELATRALSKAGYSFAEEQVLFVELKNRPGALAKAVKKLAKAGITIRYAYATASPRTKTTAAVVAVTDGDLARALKLLG